MTEEIINVGFIGGGPISTAICKAILKNELFVPDKIWVTAMYDDCNGYWRDIGAKGAKDANRTTYHLSHGEVCRECQIIFLETEPENFSRLINQCLNTYNYLNPEISQVKLPTYNRAVLFVSTVPGLYMERLLMELKRLPFNFGIVRIVTNNLFGVGNGVCLYTPGPTSRFMERYLTKLEMILSTAGTCERVPEKTLNLSTPLVSCGPAFIYIVIEALTDGAVKQGMPRKQAQSIAAHIVAGSGQMVLQSGTHPAMLKDEVCSPGAIAGISVLEDGSLRSLFIKALEASSLKFNEVIEKVHKFLKWS